MSVDRATSFEVIEVADRVLVTIGHICQRFTVVPSYADKVDFGDVDILVVCSDRNKCHELLKSIHVNRHGRDISPNGTCTSISVETKSGKQIQVDVIFCPAIEFDFSLKYFSFNDLGNLMGRIAHFLGFKLGHDGLWYIHRNPENRNEVINELLVTQNWKEAIEFLGFYEKNHFKTLEEIFSYVVQNVYFNTSIYLLENVNNERRVRDRKRKTYNEFLNYIADKGFPSTYAITKDEIRAVKLKEADVAFPNFKWALVASERELRIKKESQNLFNGDIVSDLTGLTGVELGVFIRLFKQYHLDRLHPHEHLTWHEFIINFSPEEVNAAIMDFYNEYQS